MKNELPFYLLFFGLTSVVIPNAMAWDSSGGVAIKRLLATVEFRDTLPEKDDLVWEPPLFAWNDDAKQTFLVRLEQTLWQMPIDIADLREGLKIAVSNNIYTSNRMDDAYILRNGPDDGKSEKFLGPDEDRLLEKVRAKNKKKPISTQDLINAMKAIEILSRSPYNADWNPARLELEISGPVYLGKIHGGPADGMSLFTDVLQHECMHAWEIAGHARHSYMPEKTKEFYAMQYERLSTLWETKKSAIEAESETRWNSWTESRQWSNDEILDAREKSEQEKTALLWKEYQKMKLPTRWGPSLGRSWITPGDDSAQHPDMHCMANRFEYFACLGEEMWIDPPLAEQWTSEERTWIEEHVFKNRSIIPFNSSLGFSEKQIRLPEQSIMQQRLQETKENLESQ